MSSKNAALARVGLLAAGAVIGALGAWAWMSAHQRPGPVVLADLQSAVSRAAAAPAAKAAPPLQMAAALDAASRAVTACAGHSIAVAVLEANGAPKLIYVPDGTSSAHAAFATKKALTALYFRHNTSTVAPAAEKSHAVRRLLTHEPNLVEWAGGVPIFQAGALAGAVGVSGAESETDERCAALGAASLGKPLPAPVR